MGLWRNDNAQIQNQQSEIRRLHPRHNLNDRTRRFACLGVLRMDNGNLKGGQLWVTTNQSTLVMNQSN